MFAQPLSHPRATGTARGVPCESTSSLSPQVNSFQALRPLEPLPALPLLLGPARGTLLSSTTRRQDGEGARGPGTPQEHVQLENQVRTRSNMQFHMPHNRKPAWVCNRVCAEERMLEPQEGVAGGRGYPALLEHMLSCFVSKRVQHKCSHIWGTQGRATMAASQSPPRNAILGLINLGDLDINPEWSSPVLGACVRQPVSGSRQTSPGFHAAGSVCLRSSVCCLGWTDGNRLSRSVLHRPQGLQGAALTWGPWMATAVVAVLLMSLTLQGRMLPKACSSNGSSRGGRD